MTAAMAASASALALAAAAAVCVALLAALPSEAAGGKGMGERCSDKSECRVTNAECINNICACNSSNVLVGTKCLLPVGARCDSRPCEADNSYCEVGFCVCVQNYIQAFNNTFCYKEPRYNEYCEKDHDCEILTENSICENNRCRCNRFTAMDDNKCKRKIDKLGVHCVKETEVCYLERDGNNQKVECKDQICTCKEGVNPSKDNMSCGGMSLEALSLTASFITLLLAKILA